MSQLVSEPANAGATTQPMADAGAARPLTVSLEPAVRKALRAASSGALGDIVSVDIVKKLAYPAYEGGALPAWYREAGYPFRDAGLACLYVLQELLGPIQEVHAQWISRGDDPNLAFDDWHAQVTCARGRGTLQLTSSDDVKQSHLLIQGTKANHRAELGARGVVARLTSAMSPASTEDASKLAPWIDKVTRAAEAEHAAELAKFPLSDSVHYLVTGASGSLGKATVKRLLEQGHRVRVFVRRIPAEPRPDVEYAFGNLGDPDAIDRAVRGAEKVIHIGAAMKGGWLEHKCGTVIGTKNVVDACTKHGVQQLIHISSMSVIDCAGSQERGAIDEDAATEPRAEERGAYTRAKLEAEQLVTRAAEAGLPAVILRPGQIFGGGIPLINGAVARRVAGRWLVLGDGTLELPLVYIDDVVDAILAADITDLHDGEIIQVIDHEHLTQHEVLELAGDGKSTVKIPRSVVFALGKLSELPLSLLNKPSPIAKYRLESALARLHYESDRASELLGWHPKVGVREGIRRLR